MIRKQSVNLIGEHPPNTEFASDNKELVQSLLEQIYHLKKKSTTKNITSLFIKAGKPYLIADQKVSNNNNNDKSIKKSISYSNLPILDSILTNDNNDFNNTSIMINKKNDVSDNVIEDSPDSF